MFADHWVTGYTFVFFSSRGRHTRFDCDCSSDVCSSDLSRSANASQPGGWVSDASEYMPWARLVQSRLLPNTSGLTERTGRVVSIFRSMDAACAAVPRAALLKTSAAPALSASRREPAIRSE